MDPKWLEDFRSKGYAVIPSVLSPERAKYFRQKQLEWVESHSNGFKYSNKASWKPELLPPRFKEGIYGDNSLAHEKFMWEARLDPRVKEPFEKIWQTSELLVSFDGMNVTLPQISNTKDQIPPWPHTDQFATDMNLLCVQGILNTGPCGPRDGGLVVLSGSAPLWDSFWSSDIGKAKIERERLDSIGPDDKRDLTNFKPAEIKWFEQRECLAIKVEMKPGDLVVWDSRTVHYNCAPKGSDARTAIYVCYGPREMATTGDLETKMTLFYGQLASNHWPHVNVTGSSDSTGKKSKPSETYEWTTEMLRLAGVEPYE